MLNIHIMNLVNDLVRHESPHSSLLPTRAEDGHANDFPRNSAFFLFVAYLQPLNLTFSPAPIFVRVLGKFDDILLYAYMERRTLGVLETTSQTFILSLTNTTNDETFKRFFLNHVVKHRFFCIAA